MPFIGNKPSAVPLTSADIADGIITSAKIVDGTIVNADINASAGLVLTKLASTGTLTVDNIQFPATQVASANANNLDDYEEGTFTPSFVVSSPSGTVTSLEGRYVKIGKSVLCLIKVLGTSMNIAVYARLSGLPFSVDSSFDATGVFVTNISGAQSTNGFLEFSSGTGQGYMGNHTGTTSAYYISITYAIA
jgi:hypothetical protein